MTQKVCFRVSAVLQAHPGLFMPRPRSPASPIGFVPFMFPVLVDAPPKSSEWHHEVKYDGYRTQIVLDGDGVRAYTRSAYDWTDQ